MTFDKTAKYMGFTSLLTDKDFREFHNSIYISKQKVKDAINNAKYLHFIEKEQLKKELGIE